MEPDKSNECPLDGAGVSAQSMVGRRLAEIVGSWHVYGSAAPTEPLDVWLIDDRGAAIHLTTGSDWCLIIEVSKPHAGYDMGDWGRITVGTIGGETPFADHLGEEVLEVREEYAPNTGRVALQLTFPTGRVRCESWAGDLRLTSVGRPGGSSTVR